MPKFRLVPQNRGFYELFDRSAGNLVQTAELLVDLLQHYPARRELVGRIKDHEHVGDDVTHEIVQLLSQSFVTPIDREDMYDLASALDDICDFMDQVADELSLYSVNEVQAEAIEQATVIHRAVVRLAQAIAGLEGLRISATTWLRSTSWRMRATASSATPWRVCSPTAWMRWW